MIHSSNILVDFLNEPYPVPFPHEYTLKMPGKKSEKFKNKNGVDFFFFLSTVVLPLTRQINFMGFVLGNVTIKGKLTLGNNKTVS